MDVDLKGPSGNFLKTVETSRKFRLVKANVDKRIYKSLSGSGC